jgi:hypothetical protein
MEPNPVFMDEVLKQFDKDTQLLVVSRRSKGQGVGNGRVLQGTVLEVGRGWKGVMRAKLGFGEARPTCNTHTQAHLRSPWIAGKLDTCICIQAVHHPSAAPAGYDMSFLLAHRHIAGCRAARQGTARHAHAACCSRCAPLSRQLQAPVPTA